MGFEFKAENWTNKGLCPYCGSDNWQMKGNQNDIDEAFVTFKCRTCENKWRNRYTYQDTHAGDGRDV